MYLESDVGTSNLYHDLSKIEKKIGKIGGKNEGSLFRLVPPMNKGLPNPSKIKEHSVEPNPQTGKVRLVPFPNPGSSTNIELRTSVVIPGTDPNPPKIPNFKPTNWVRPNT